jgi:hypothetical protein
MSDLSSLLRDAIDATGFAEVVEMKESEKKVTALCRVSDKVRWVGVIEHVLVNKKGWRAHICQHYFLRGRKLVFGWNFVVQADDDIQAAVKNAASLVSAGSVNASVIASNEGGLESFPLFGASSRRMAKNLVFDVRAPGPSRGGPSHKGAFEVNNG